MTIDLSMQNKYLTSFLIHFSSGHNPVLDIDGSILSLKQARIRLSSFISTAGSPQMLITLMNVEGETDNAKLASLLELIRACRAQAESENNPQVKAYWNLRAEVVTIIHSYFRDSVYP